MDSTEVLPTPAELALVVKMICNQEVMFQYKNRSKRGVAENNWAMYVRWSPNLNSHWNLQCETEATTKGVAWELMVPDALAWADRLARRLQNIRARYDF
jgi:hypothetical protein